MKLAAKAFALASSAPGSLVALVILFIAVFHKPLLLGKCISRVGESALRDGAFRADSPLSPLFPDFDPCIYNWYLPVRSFLSGSIADGALPLWNPYRSIGFSELSHPSQSILNPVLLMSPVGNEYLYCAAVVLQALFGAAGTMAACRYLGLGQWSCFWAATAFGLSCRLTAGLELPLFDCFVPWLLLSVMWLLCPKPQAEARTPVSLEQRLFNVSLPVRTVMVAMLWAFGFLSMHVEVFVISLFACLGGFFLEGLLFHWKTPKLVWNRFTAITIAGLFSLCFVAPALVPMLLHMQACDFYKIEVCATATSAFPQLLRDLSGWKGFDASPWHSIFCGVYTAIPVPVAMLLPRLSEPRSYSNLCSMLRAIGLIAALTIIWAYPFSPITELLARPPLSWLAPQYFLPLAVLTVTVLSACGLELLIKCSSRQRFLASLILLLTPGVAGAMFMLAGAQIVCKPVTLLLLALGIGLFISLVWSKRVAKSLLLIALLAINIATLTISLSRQMPARPHVREALRLPATLESIRNSSQRLVVCGSNYFLPNISTLYKINQIGIADPFPPKGYCDFLVRAGATMADGFSYTFSHFPSRNIIATGARYLASRGPIVPADLMVATGSDMNVSLSNAGLLSGLRAIGGWARVDHANKQIFGQVKVHMHPLLRSYTSPKFMVGLLGKDSHLLNESEVEWNGCLPEKFPSDNLLSFAVEIPENASFGKLAIKVVNQWNGVTMSPVSLTSRAGDWTILSEPLLRQTADSPTADSATTDASGQSNWLRLVSTAPGGHRLYEIRTPLPMMFFAYGDTSKISTHTLVNRAAMYPAKSEPSAHVNTGNTLSSRSVNNDEGRYDFTCSQWKMLANNRFEAKVNAPTTGYVVLLQSFFPGWSCTVDGTAAKILRFDKVFQAVAIQPGNHTVQFTFIPPGTPLGLLIFSAGAVATCAILLRGRRRTGRLSNDKEDQALQTEEPCQAVGASSLK